MSAIAALQPAPLATTHRYDVLTIGRSSIDLYSNDVGAPFEAIKNFAAYVGGCPTNVSVGALPGPALGAADRGRH